MISSPKREPVFLMQATFTFSTNNPTNSSLSSEERSFQYLPITLYAISSKSRELEISFQSLCLRSSRPSPSSKEISFRIIFLIRSPCSPDYRRVEVDISKKTPRNNSKLFFCSSYSFRFPKQHFYEIHRQGLVSVINRTKAYILF